MDDAIRQRAIDVLVRSRAWSRAESVLDALDRAGLVLVDAAEYERDREALHDATRLLVQARRLVTESIDATEREIAEIGARDGRR